MGHFRPRDTQGRRGRGRRRRSPPGLRPEAQSTARALISLCPIRAGNTGSVAKLEAGWESAGARPRSGRDPKQARHEGGLSPHINPANVSNLPLSDHRHSLVASQGSSGGWQTAKAETRPDQALDAPMILLNDVVQVLDLA